MRHLFLLFVALSLAAAACGRGGDADASSTTTVATTATTAESTTTAPSSTTTQASTTTEPPQVAVTTDLEGSTSNALDAAVAGVYAAALNPGQVVYGNIPDGLLAQFADRVPATDPVTVSGVVHTGTVLETGIAVAVVGETDVVLAVEAAPDQWDIVGARLTSLGEPAWYGDGPTQILVIGSDARPGGKVEGHRADSVHILSALPGAGTASIVGIPRDTWVEVNYEGEEEVGGMDKLTHTMASRGPEFVVDAVTNLTEVEIDGYLLTGFLGFQQLIDAFDGFMLDVPYRMNDIKSFSNFQPGLQHMDGTEALAFSRNRRNAPGGDFGRSFNHGLVMKAVLMEMQNRGGVEQVPMLLSILVEFVQTDMTPAELLNMAAATFEFDPLEVDNIVVPGTTGWRSGRNVVLLGDEAHAIFADIADDGLLELPEEDDEG